MYRHSFDPASVAAAALFLCIAAVHLTGTPYSVPAVLAGLGVLCVVPAIAR